MTSKRNWRTVEKHAVHTDTSMLKLVGLFSVSGNDVCALLKSGDECLYYDKQGLAFIINEKKDKGLDASVEEEALRQIETLITSAVRAGCYIKGG